MARSLKAGNRGGWASHGGEAHGRVVRKRTSPMTIQGRRVAASAEAPQYIVETGDDKRAAHKPGAFRRSG